jgi:guanine deaminase
MQAIREACKKIGSPHLEGCVLYTSAESCPMCLGAAYWAHIQEIYYGATVEDAKKYGDFQDVDMFEEFKKDASKRKIGIHCLMRDEAIVVWKKFSEMPGHVHY